MLRSSLGISSALLLLLVVGCVTPVTREQIANADYGTVPPTYQEKIKEHMQGVLFDPYSAHYRFFGEPQKGYAYVSGTINPKPASIWLSGKGRNQCKEPNGRLCGRTAVSFLWQK